MSKFRYGVACSLNDVSTTAPITLRGPIEQLCKEAKEIGYDGYIDSEYEGQRGQSPAV